MSMYRIEELHDEFGSFVLEDGENRVCIMANRGGLVQRFLCKGHEVLFCNMETVRDWSREVRGGIPILFPACGRLKEGRYGTVPKHGFARNLKWEKSGESTDGAAALTLSIRDTADTRKVYPHGFVLSHTHTLRGNTLNIRQTVTNTGDNDMPFSLGLHPYFSVDPTVATATVPSHLYEGLDGENAFDGAFAFKNNYDSVCKNLFGNESVLDTGLGYRVRISWKAPYRYCVVWSPEEVEFACIEPWTAPPNALNTGVDVLTLKPGESAVCEMGLSVEED